jgi:neutral ceramidase
MTATPFLAVSMLILPGQAALKAGFTAVDITPDAGAEIPGGFGKLIAEGTRDPLLAVAAVFSDGSTSLALVGIDALAVPRKVVEEARSLVERETGIPGKNVLVGASHTHSGGPIFDGFGSTADPGYLARVARAIAAAVRQAHAGLRAAEAGIASGREDTIAYNRRFLMRDGREITHPGKPGTAHHGEIVRPAGPIDPEVGVLAVREGERVRGLIVNYTCHVTVVGGRHFSADYVGALRRRLEEVYGAGTPVVFLQGACGDVTQVDNMSPRTEFGEEHAELMGAKLAAEVVRTVAGAPWSKELPLAAASLQEPVSIRPEPDADAERPPFGLGSGQDAVFAAERARVAEIRKATPVIRTEVQALRLGPLGIAATEAEYFCEYGLRIKAASKHARTWVVGYANGYVGYVTTAQAMVGGGYEVRTARSSMLSIDAGQRILEAAVRALGKVR